MKPNKEELIKELEDMTAISAVAYSEGGKILLKGLTNDVVSSIDTLCIKHKDLTVQQFVSLCADIKTKLDLIRVIKRSPNNKSYLEDLLKEIELD